MAAIAWLVILGIAAPADARQGAPSPEMQAFLSRMFPGGVPESLPEEYAGWARVFSAHYDSGRYPSPMRLIVAPGGGPLQGFLAFRSFGPGLFSYRARPVPGFGTRGMLQVDRTLSALADTPGHHVPVGTGGIDISGNLDAVVGRMYALGYSFSSGLEGHGLYRRPTALSLSRREDGPRTRLTFSVDANGELIRTTQALNRWGVDEGPQRRHRVTRTGIEDIQ
ncbi:MAG: hypothetical protein HY078_16020 [Elusimicrobia bacterium]|nr:hypothetical protein [Elusimicrobiota bacterium]